MMRRFFSFLFFLMIALFAFTQNSYTQGKIEIFQDSRIPTLVQKHIYLSHKNKIEGWRVQIFFDSGNNSKSRAYSNKAQFMGRYPEVSAYIAFQSPNYKVRVGDFRARLDAEGFRQQILDDFPDAYVVMDEIEFPSF